MNIRPIIYALTFIAAVICVFLSVRKCERRQDVNTAYVAKPEAQRTHLLNVDSLKSTIENQYREKLQGQISAYKARYSELATKYQALQKKGSNSVKTYHTSRTLANCDTALTDALQRVSNLEAQVSILDSSGVVKDQIIWSQTGTILRSDSVKQALSNGWKEANLNGAKWEKKAKRRGKVIAVFTAVFAAVIGGFVVTN